LKALERLPAGTVLLAAVSGGADSTAMLAALAAIGPAAGFCLNVLHVEHGIRPAQESRSDAAAVKLLCSSLNVPCRVVTVAPGRIEQAGREWGIGTEAAARFFRRRAMIREAGRLNAVKIMTAHTSDDNLETILMRILRGSGPSGLAGIPAQKGRFIRPLINLTRADVLSYLESRGIPYRTDSTNSDMRYLRNRIRLQLIPCLDSFFPFWRNSLSGFAQTQAMAAGFISAEAKKRLHWNIGRAFWVKSADFLAQPLVIQEEAVFGAADCLLHRSRLQGRSGAAFSVPRRRSLRGLLSDINAGKSGAGDLGPVRLAAERDRLVVTKTHSGVFESGFSLLVDNPGDYCFKGIRIRVSAAAEGIPAGGSAFYAGLPLVFKKTGSADSIIRAGHRYLFSDILKQYDRSNSSGFMTAGDSEGNTAFIAAGRDPGVIFCKNRIPGAGDYEILILTGGTDE